MKYLLLAFAISIAMWFVAIALVNDIWNLISSR